MRVKAKSGTPERVTVYALLLGIALWSCAMFLLGHYWGGWDAVEEVFGFPTPHQQGALERWGGASLLLAIVLALPGAVVVTLGLGSSIGDGRSIGTLISQDRLVPGTIYEVLAARQDGKQHLAILKVRGGENAREVTRVKDGECIAVSFRNEPPPIFWWSGKEATPYTVPAPEVAPSHS
ncbi:MAG: hypothetical protein HY436_00300 [Candidatus Liptonbacteria bacterium]|nr:hypothetical protein [Candidatus Liptonbacteria bacterium]